MFLNNNTKIDLLINKLRPRIDMFGSFSSLPSKCPITPYDKKSYLLTAQDVIKNANTTDIKDYKEALLLDKIHYLSVNKNSENAYMVDTIVKQIDEVLSVCDNKLKSAPKETATYYSFPQMNSLSAQTNLLGNFFNTDSITNLLPKDLSQTPTAPVANAPNFSALKPEELSKLTKEQETQLQKAVSNMSNMMRSMPMMTDPVFLRFKAH